MGKNGIKSLTTAVLFGLLLSACEDHSSRSNSASTTSSLKPDQTVWQPKWDTKPEKEKTAKPLLTPTLAFVDEGFRGSPMPQAQSEKLQQSKTREDFAQAFRDERACFGVTLILNNSRTADLGIQVFEGIDGRTGRWQWILYRMDTLGAVASGEVTSGQERRLDLTVGAVCNSVHDAVTHSGGTVEAE